MNPRPRVTREIGGSFDTFENMIMWVKMNLKYQSLDSLLLNNPFVWALEQKWIDHWIDKELEKNWNDEIKMLEESVLDDQYDSKNIETFQ